ncbi:MAG: hypothetical protein MJ171_03455 [Clostridia bacterium]|nr:hypothetical protein [Clostridia bacterium]
MICEKCNKEMIRVEKGRDLIWKCPECTFSIATTNPNDMDTDCTIYQLFILPNDEITKDKRDVIKQLLGCFTLESASILKDGKMIKQGYAWEILDTINALMSNDIKFKITPNFPY